MAGTENPLPKQSYGQRHHVNSCDESKTKNDGKGIHLSYIQGNRILGACNALTYSLNMGYGSHWLARVLVGEMNSALEEPYVSGEKVPLYNGTQSHFICATPKCEGKLSEAARARQRCDPMFKPRVCTVCHLKGARTDYTNAGETAGSTMPLRSRSVGRNSSVPLVMQVSTAAAGRAGAEIED
jgi:hypothetical protein